MSTLVARLAGLLLVVAATVMCPGLAGAQGCGGGVYVGAAPYYAPPVRAYAPPAYAAPLAARPYYGSGLGIDLSYRGGSGYYVPRTRAYAPDGYYGRSWRRSGRDWCR